MLVGRCEGGVFFWSNVAALTPETVFHNGLAPTTNPFNRWEAADSTVVDGWLGLAGQTCERSLDSGGSIVVSAGRTLFIFIKNLLKFVRYVSADATFVSPLLHVF